MAHDDLGDLAAFSKGELVKLATSKWWGRVTNAIHTTIAKSFNEDAVLRPVKTRDEVRRRFNICAKAFVILRRDLKWSIPRIIDELPRALRSQLDGIPWDPEGETRTVWAPSDAPSMELVNTGEGDLAPDPT